MMDVTSMLAVISKMTADVVSHREAAVFVRFPESRNQQARQAQQARAPCQGNDRPPLARIIVVELQAAAAFGKES